MNSEIRFGNASYSRCMPSYLAFATGNSSSPTERMRIDSLQDDVGIGTDNPVPQDY